MSGASNKHYKNSGVDWLSGVPDHWQIKRLKFVAANKKFAIVDGPFGTQLKAEDYRESGIPLVRISNLSYKGEFDIENLVFIDTDKAAELGRSSVYIDDVVLGKTGATIGKSALINHFEWGIIASSCLKISPNKNIITAKFLLYSVISDGFQKTLINTSGGSTRDTINIEPFENLSIVLPSLEEQNTIVSFLDFETAKIDELIREQHHLIELLKEKRQSVIAHVVTKGLNPNVLMKDSGIEWAGKLPERWKTVALKWISQIFAGGTPDKQNQSYWENGTIPWLNSGTVNQANIQEPSAFITEEAYKNSSAKWVPKNALVMALAGQGKTKGTVAQLAISATCNQSMAAIIPNEMFCSRFLLWYLTSKYENIRNLAGGDDRDGLNLDLVGSIPCPLIPIEEQTAIATFLDYETAKIDALINESNKAIDLLKERRNAIITAAITGKIDISNINHQVVS
jgi:type I restriction enzyme, S subunit